MIGHAKSHATPCFTTGGWAETGWISAPGRYLLRHKWGRARCAPYSNGDHTGFVVAMANEGQMRCAFSQLGFSECYFWGIFVTTKVNIFFEWGSIDVRFLGRGGYYRVQLSAFVYFCCLVVDIHQCLLLAK